MKFFCRLSTSSFSLCFLLLFGLPVPSKSNAEEFRFDFENGTSDHVPAPYIYDPLSGESKTNQFAARLQKKLEIAPVNGSFTLEGFFHPDTVLEKTIDLLGKERASSSAASLTAGLRRLSNFKQTYWGGSLTLPGEKNPLRWSTGHYVSHSRLREDTMGWRHLALVYDSEKLTVSVWLDHWQESTQTLTETLALDSEPLFVSSEFEGLVDSVRLTKRALGPEHFLRATAKPLKNVTFDHEENVFPHDAGHLSVKRNFGAVGDGKTDDTAAIQKAFEATNGHQASGEGTYVLYFPAGTYLVSDTVKWKRFLRVQGEDRESTIIKLVDNATGFDNTESPKPVVAASAVPGPPGSNKAVNGSTIANWFHHFTVDTGNGNPGAVGVEYHSNNYGSLEQVTIRSGDGEGVTGLDLTHKTNGPTLIAHTSVEGFSVGIKTAYMEYSVTMEDVHLSGQKEVGIFNRGNILALNRIKSRNRVPFLQTGNGNDMITLLNSDLTGGDAKASAIESNGALYARNVAIEGYGTSITKQAVTWNPHRKEKTKIEPAGEVTGNIEEYISDATIHPDNEEARSLGLEIRDAPEVPLGDKDLDWVNVRDFSNLVVGDGKKADWAAAIEAAFATGKPTVYFPRGPYDVSRTVVVPPSVKRLYGMDNGISKGGLADKKNPGYETMTASLRVEGETNDPLLLDFFSVSMLEHASPRPILLQHARYAYRGLPGAGNVFIRDSVSPWWSFSPGQKVWARQWNVESHAEGPCILADGADVWSLGFKTEYGSQKLRAINGASVEIFGAFIYPVVKAIPKDRPVFEIIDSRFAAQWGLSVYTASHNLQVRDIKNGEVRETILRNGRQLGPRFRFDFYSND